MMTSKKGIAIICLGNGQLTGLGGGLVRTLELTKKLHLSNNFVFVICSPGSARLFQDIIPNNQIKIFPGYLSKYLPKTTLFGMMLFYVETLFYFPKRQIIIDSYYCQSEYIWDVLPAIRYANFDLKNVFVMFHHIVKPNLTSLFSSMLGSIIGQRLGFYLIKKHKLNVLCYEGPAGQEVFKISEKIASSVFRVKNGIADLNTKPSLINSKLKHIMEQRICVTFVGGLRPQKGLEIFDDFMTNLIDQNSTILVLVVGRTPKKTMKRLEKTYGSNLLFTGPLQNIEALSVVKASGLAFLPSTTEGFGIFPLECVAQKTPIVCLPLPVLKNTYGRKLAYANDVSGASLADKVQTLISDHNEYIKYKNILENDSTTDFVKKYSWDEILNNDLLIMKHN